MLDGYLEASALTLCLATLLLFLAGRLPLTWRVWRVLIGSAIGVAVELAVGGGHNQPAVLAVAAATILGALVMPRTWWAVGTLVVASLAVATGLYFVYLVTVTLVLVDSPLSLLLGLVLLALELGALTLMAASVYEMLDALGRPVRIPALPAPPRRWPTVCLQVPAHQEPPDLVIETIRSLAALDYPREALVVQVLDNNTTDEELWRPLEAECARLGEAGWRVQFVHLENWPGFKAGALNWGREHLPDDVEIVGIVDADYVVEAHFLRQTIPYFTDPTVAFLQTPQEYRAWEDSAFYRACHTGFAYFFQVGMISRSYRNSIIFAGTMGLIRRTELDAIGGWDEEIITEDAEASLRMLARGGRGIYIPKAFGRGIMPLTYEALRKQRFRWAFGGIQILRRHWSALMPWSGSGLTLRQRRDYLLGGLWWFNDALTLGFTLFVAATALGVVTGRPFVVQRLTGIGIILPVLYIVLGLVRYLWGLRVATKVGIGEAFEAMKVNLSLSWVVSLACARGLIEEHGVFLRTPKFRGSGTARELRVVLVETFFAVGSLALSPAVVFTGGLTTLTLSLIALLGWAALIFGSATDYALGDPTRPPAALRQKASLELAPALVGRVVRSTRVRTGTIGAVTVGVLLLVASLIGESGRVPITRGMPLQPLLEPPPVHATGGAGRDATPSPSPSPRPGASSTPAPNATSTPEPSASPQPSPTDPPSPSPAPGNTPLASPPPGPTPTPVARPTPPGRPAATASPVPTARATPQPTATPAPSPSATTTPQATPAPVPTATPAPTTATAPATPAA